MDHSKLDTLYLVRDSEEMILDTGNYIGKFCGSLEIGHTLYLVRDCDGARVCVGYNNFPCE